MKKAKLIVLYILCLPTDLLSYGGTLFVWLCWGENLRWENGGLWCNLKYDCWLLRKPDKKSLNPYKRFSGLYRGWAGSTTGHGGFYNDPPISTIAHEFVHTKQYEAYIIKAYLLLGLVGILQIWLSFFFSSVVSFVILSNGYHTWTANWIHAWFLDKPIYKGSLHEESARALEKHYRKRIIP
jgi:hypothetical protein